MKKKLIFFLGVAVALCACDLQPKIIALPDTIGEFISSRYPALLADPYAQPEIYDSAASDYGIYASPKLYGSVDGETHVEYASVNDYIVPPQAASAKAMYGELPVEKTKYIKAEFEEEIASGSVKEVTIAQGDTLYSLAKKYKIPIDKLADENGLSAPYLLSIGQKLKIPAGKESVASKGKTQNTPTTTKVALKDVTVKAGDTLYSLSRTYSVPVNDLAVMNKLSAPFTLSIGQVLKVPNLESANILKKDSSEKVSVEKTGEKISSDPRKKLPKINARSSSKFSWPVKGRLLSHYGAKSKGLFNDGINIGASDGVAVKAAENGVVAYAGNEVKGMGNLIIIQHSGGWMTVYSHLKDMNVRRGTKVAVGEKIGSVGATGKVNSPQLHFEIRKGTKAYDPESYLKTA